MRIYILFLLLIAGMFSAQQSALKEEVKYYLKDKKAEVSVSVLGIEEEFQMHIDGDKRLPMQSVYKFHIAMAVLDQVDKGQLSLQQAIWVSKDDLLPDTWSPLREKYPNGNINLPLSEIINYTVSQSDNNGCDILLRLLGGAGEVQKFLDNRGIKDVQVKNSEEQMHANWDSQFENYGTTRSIASTLKEFYLGKLLSKKSTDYLYDVMLGTLSGKDKIKQSLPSGTVAHKTGSSGRNSEGLKSAENDAGIITLPNLQHYTLVVFVNNSKKEDAYNTGIIAEVSKIVYEQLIKNNN